MSTTPIVPPPAPPSAPAREPSPLWQVAYYATAVLAGLILLTGVLPSPIDFVAYLALGLGATWIQYRRAGRDTFTSSLSWLAVVGITWLPLAWFLGRTPFD